MEGPCGQLGQREETWGPCILGSGLNFYFALGLQQNPFGGGAQLITWDRSGLNEKQRGGINVAKLTNSDVLETPSSTCILELAAPAFLPSSQSLATCPLPGCREGHLWPCRPGGGGGTEEGTGGCGQGA